LVKRKERKEKLGSRGQEVNRTQRRKQKEKEKREQEDGLNRAQGRNWEEKSSILWCYRGNEIRDPDLELNED